MGRINIEHLRLKNAVVDAVRQWREMRLMQGGTHRSIAATMEAMDALLAFERENGLE